MASLPWKIARFNRRLIAGTVTVFGVGTTISNLVALFVPHGVPIERAPAAFLTFDALMGLGYLAAAWGIGLERRWSLPWVWTLAVLHALAAALLATLWVGGGALPEAAVPASALWVALGREGFWVLIGLYVWKGG